MFAPQLPKPPWYKRLWWRLKWWWFLNIYPRKIKFPELKDPSYGLSIDDLVTANQMTEEPKNDFTYNR